MTSTGVRATTEAYAWRWLVELRARLEMESEGFHTVVEPMCAASAMVGSWHGNGRLILRVVSPEFHYVVKWLHGDPDECAAVLASKETFPLSGFVKDTLLRMRIGDEVVSRPFLDSMPERDRAQQLWREVVIKAREVLDRAEIISNVRLRDLFAATDSEDTFYYVDPFYCGKRYPHYQCQEFPDLVKFLKSSERKGKVVARDVSRVIAEYVKCRTIRIGMWRVVVL